MRWLTALAFIALSVSVSSSQTSSGEQPSSIQPLGGNSLTVVVQDPSGASLPKSWVRVQHWSFPHGTGEPKLIVDAGGNANANGEFYLELPDQGRYDVFVSSAAFVPGSAVYEVHRGYPTRRVFQLGIVSGSGLEWQ